MFRNILIYSEIPESEEGIYRRASSSSLDLVEFKPSLLAFRGSVSRDHAKKILITNF